MNILLSRFLYLVFICSVTISTHALALSPPGDPRGTEIRQNTVKWEWQPVQGAHRYEVSINWQVVGTTGATSLESFNLFAGDYYMSVRSVAHDGTRSEPSPTVLVKTSKSFNADNPAKSRVFSSRSSQPLPTPTGTWGKEIRPKVVQWGWNSVAGAATYDVHVDGKYAGTTQQTTWTSENLWVGTHSMAVTAVSADKRMSSRSPDIRIYVSGNPGTSTDSTSQAASGALSAPKNPRGQELSPGKIRWQWDKVTGASKYDVIIDGKWAGQTSNTKWDVARTWGGDHSMTVKAIDANGNLSPKSRTVKITVKGSNGQPVSVSEDSSTTQLAREPVAAPPPQPSSAPDPNAADVQSLVDPASYEIEEVKRKQQNWELTFSDEFNGDRLNPYRWHSQLRWDGEWNGERYEYRIINGEAQFYVNVLSEDPEHRKDVVPLHNPFKFNGNRLAIQAIRNPKYNQNHNRAFGKMDDMISRQPFLSGAISTHEKFSQKYGYFEASIKIPNHTGTFPAFWLFHSRRAWEGTQRTEIDIMENLGHAPWYVYNSFHFFKNVSTTYSGDANFIKPEPSGQIFRQSGFSDDFHVYAVEWSPGSIKWFIDGEQVSSLRHGEVDFEELYVMLNLAMGGNWTNFPKNAGGLGRPWDQRYPTADDIANFSNPQLEIDYVRVYKPK